MSNDLLLDSCKDHLDGETFDIKKLQQKRRIRIMLVWLSAMTITSVLWCGANAWGIIRNGDLVPTYTLEIAHSLPTSDYAANYALALDWEPWVGKQPEVRPELRLADGTVIPTKVEFGIAVGDVRDFGSRPVRVHIPLGVTPGQHNGRVLLLRQTGAEDLPSVSALPISLGITPWWQHWWPSLAWFGVLILTYIVIYAVCVFTLYRPHGFIYFETPDGSSTRRIPLRLPFGSRLLPWRRPFLSLGSLSTLGVRTKASLCFLLKDSPHLQDAEPGRYRYHPKVTFDSDEANPMELPSASPFMPMDGRVFLYILGEDTPSVTFWFAAR